MHGKRETYGQVPRSVRDRREQGFVVNMPSTQETFRNTFLCCRKVILSGIEIS